MTDTKNLPLIPMIFTGAGACLTAKNWWEVGVRTLSCSLAELLFKPGVDVLYQLDNLAQYLGWSGQLVLNATMPKANVDSSYTLRSPHDGSRYTLLPETILTLIERLKPDYVILPQELANNENTVIPFVESNQAAEDALEGKIYTEEGVIDIKNREMEMQFIPIDAQCSCPSCRQLFTRAYLHHLLENTPLLAQRFLIMHNVYWLNNYKKI